MGALGRSVAAKLIGMLDDRHDAVYLLDKRALGLMSRSDDGYDELADLTGGDVRFVNRQPGSATRLTFDGLLGEHGIAPGDIRGYRDEEYTHTAVAALVVSRDVDAAFGAEDAARHFGLCFVPMVEERFYIVVNRACDSSVRQAAADFCAALEFDDAAKMKADERTPTVAVLKRVHRAGFWKSA
jgi:molybdate-binding protein